METIHGRIDDNFTILRVDKSSGIFVITLRNGSVVTGTFSVRLTTSTSFCHADFTVEPLPALEKTSKPKTGKQIQDQMDYLMASMEVNSYLSRCAKQAIGSYFPTSKTSEELESEEKENKKKIRSN